MPDPNRNDEQPYWPVPGAQGPQPVQLNKSALTPESISAFVGSHKHPQDRKEAADYVKMWLIAEHNAKLRAQDDERQNTARRSLSEYEYGQRRGLLESEVAQRHKLEMEEKRAATKEALEAAKAFNKGQQIDQQGGIKKEIINTQEAGRADRQGKWLEQKERATTDTNDYRYASLEQQKEIADQKARAFQWAKQNGWTQDQYEAQLRFIDHEMERTLKGGPLLGGPQMPAAPRFIGPSEDGQPPAPFQPRDNTNGQQGYESLLRQAEAEKTRQILDINATEGDSNLTQEAKAKLLPGMKAKLEQTKARVIGLQKEAQAYQYMAGDATKLKESQAEQAAYGQRVKPEVEETDEDIRKRLREIIKANTTTDRSGAVSIPTMTDAIRIYKEERTAVKALREEERKGKEATQAQGEHDRYRRDTEQRQAKAEQDVREGLEYTEYKRRVFEQENPKQAPASPSPEAWQPPPQDQTFDQWTPPAAPVKPQFDVNTAQGLPVTGDPATMQSYQAPESVQPAPQASLSQADLFAGMTAAPPPGGLQPLNEPQPTASAPLPPIQTRVNGGAWQAAPPSQPAAQSPTDAARAKYNAAKARADQARMEAEAPLPASPFLNTPRIPAPQPVIETGTQRDLAMAGAEAQPVPEFYSPETNTRYSRADVEAAAKKRGMTLDQAVKWLKARGMTLDFKE